MSKIMKNVVLTGEFVAPRIYIAQRAVNLGVSVFGTITKNIDTVVVGTSTVLVSTKEKSAHESSIEVITESEFIKRLAILEMKQMNDVVLKAQRCRCVDVKIQLPGEIHNVEVNGTLSYDWKVGDTCWASNEEGYHFGDDMFEFIGDDVTLEIMSLYDNDGTPMSVVRRHQQGMHQCFRVDMLRPIKSKRDKVIDRAMSICDANDITHPNFKFLLGKLYDEEMLNDEAVV